MTSTEGRAPATFTTLPVELHDLIFPYLDPIGLISLSQTSTTFRALICPQPHNFTERLLALELDPRYGGPIPLYTGSPDIMLPSFEDVEAWYKIKHACTSCAKLLSHLAFDNHSILRLRKREPLPSQPTAHLEAWDRRPMCNWVDRLLCNWYGRVSAKSRGKHFQARIKADKTAAIICKEIRRQSDEEQPMPNLRAADAWLCGSERRRRTCNECRFQRGDFDRPTNSNCGDAITPVIKSRPKKFHDSVERYFPGLVPPPIESSKGDDVKDRNQNGLVAFYASQEIRYPIHQRIYRQRELTYDFWILYQVRCAGCKSWRELRHFRRGGPGHYKATPKNAPSWASQASWNGPEFPSWRCNQCVMNGDGREVLAEELLKHWCLMATHEMYTCKSSNVRGWGFLSNFLEKNKMGVTWATLIQGAMDGLSGKESSIAQAMLGSGRLACMLALGIDSEYRAGSEALAVLFVCWKHFVETKLKPIGIWARPTPESALTHSHKDDGPVMNSWFQTWTEDYFVKEARWSVLDERNTAFNANPSLLVDYALQGETPPGEQVNETYSDIDEKRAALLSEASLRYFD